MPELYLVRHGQSQWNLENRFTGWKDPDLTEQGRREAAHAGALLSQKSIQHAFTSELLRAQHTLQIILRVCGLTIPVVQTSAFNERCYGDLEGLNKTETVARFGEEQVRLWRRSYDVAPPGGESLQDTERRVLPYYKSKVEPLLQADNSVLLVAHGNSLRVLMMHLEHISAVDIVHTEIATGTPLGYRWEGGAYTPVALRAASPE